MEKGFELEKINPADPNDLRGPTYGLSVPGTIEITIVDRNKGFKFGGHYHKGDDPSKNPEKLFLAKGKMNAIFVSKDNNKTELTLEAPVFLTIFPGTHHLFEALDNVIIVEARTTRFNKDYPDSYASE